MEIRLSTVRYSALLLPQLFITFLLRAQSPPTDQHALLLQKYPVATFITTIDDLSAELAAKHPGFYRYHVPEAFGAFIDSVKNSVTDSLTALEVFAKMKTVIAHIGCLHTELSLEPEFAEALNAQPNLLPLQLHVESNRAFVVRNLSDDKSILAGDEVMSINGQPIASIIARLLALIPSDGYNQTLKYQALYHQFPLWYRYIHQTLSFQVVLKRNGEEHTHGLPGARKEEIATDSFLKEPTHERELDFRLDNGVAFLTIRSFSESAVKAGGQRFRQFIDDAFSAIGAGGISKLIVDLRGNTGGSDGNAVYFTSYFFDRPFRYWDRIEVTEAIAKDIKGLGITLFYRKPIKKDGVWHWQKAKTVRDFDYYEPQQPAKTPYMGDTYILTDGFCMSSCSDAATVLDENGKALFIGTETGGGYQGNNSGLMPSSPVEPFPFSVTVPLQKYVTHVDTAKNIGRGVIPDVPVAPSVIELVAGKDPAMAKAIELASGENPL